LEICSDVFLLAFFLSRSDSVLFVSFQLLKHSCFLEKKYRLRIGGVVIVVEK